MKSGKPFNLYFSVLIVGGQTGTVQLLDYLFNIAKPLQAQRSQKARNLSFLVARWQKD